MQAVSISQIRQVERLQGGLVVTFSDGACFFYSATLLRSTMPFAEDLVPSKMDEQDRSV